MIILTGSSGGLGRYIIDNLEEDFEIIGTYNTHKPGQNSQRVSFYQVDITDFSSVERFVASISDKLQKIILINMAGISLEGMGHKMNENTWDTVVDTNLKGAFLMSRALLPFMRQQKWGRIINISSVVGQIAVPGTVAYSASKSGLFGLTRTLAVENVLKNITVNVLALGYYNTGMINVIPPEIQDKIIASIPMKRFGEPRNIELAIRFLIECDYITGTSININGGLI